jgi:triosephosphate isomerase
MHLLSAEARDLYSQFVELVASSGQIAADSPVKVRVAAPSVHLPLLQRQGSSLVEYGAQNVHHEPSGAFTGEISVPMIRDYGGGFSLVGHSERRLLFGESENLLAQRLEGALHQGLPVVYCIGETLVERESGATESVLETQCETITHLVERFSHLITLAYEPVWAIGTGKVASPQEIETAHKKIKSLLVGNCSDQTPSRVLYGGSVKADNIKSLLEIPEVDGVLVGGASLNIDTFRPLFQAAVEVQ